MHPDTDYPGLEACKCPYPFFADLQEHQRVHESPRRKNEFLVTRFEDVHWVLAHPEIFSSTLFASTIFSDTAELREGLRTVGNPEDEAILATHAQDPPAHTEQRQFIGRAFTPKAIRSYTDTVQTIVDRLIDGFIDRGECDFVRDFTEPLTILITCELLGLPEEDLPLLKEWSLQEGPGLMYHPAEEQERQIASGERLGEYLAKALLDRRATPTDDILSDMIARQIERDWKFNLNYLLAESGLLLLGGIDNSSNGIASTMQLLVTNPEALTRVAADPGSITRVFEEALRAEAPVQWLPRYALRDNEIAGVRVPVGSTVLCSLAAANRDQSAFAGPAELRLDRANVRSHLSFGYGIHFCLGAPLVRLEARLTFETLFRRAKNIRLAAKQGEITTVPSTVFRGPSELWIEFDRADEAR